MAAFSTRGLKVYLSIENATDAPWTGAANRTADTDNPANATIPGVPFCLDSISRDAPQGDTISLATFCNPDAQASGAPGAGSLSWGGPIDFCDPGFIEMHAALASGDQHYLIIEFPQSQGYMTMPIEINAYSETFGLNAAAAWTGGAVVKGNPTYVPTCP